MTVCGLILNAHALRVGERAQGRGVPDQQARVEVVERPDLFGQRRGGIQAQRRYQPRRERRTNHRRLVCRVA